MEILGPRRATIPTAEFHELLFVDVNSASPHAGPKTFKFVALCVQFTPLLAAMADYGGGHGFKRFRFEVTLRNAHDLGTHWRWIYGI